MDLKNRPYGERLVVAAAGYALALGIGVVISNGLAPPPASLPAGFALAAVILLGWDVWPAFLVISLIGAVIAGWPLAVALAAAVAAAAEPVVGAWLLARADLDPALDHTRDVLVFMALGVALAPTVGMLPGAAALATNWGAAADTTIPGVLQWWLADAIGILAVTPFVLTLEFQPRGALEFRRALPLLEALALAATILAVSVLSFGPLGTGLPSAVPFVAIPLLIWAAVRFRQLGAAAASFIFCIVAVWGTANGLGVFAPLSGPYGYVPVQLMLGFLVPSVLALGATVSERANAERRYRDLVERIPAVTYEAGLAETDPTEYVSPQIRDILGYSPADWYGTAGEWIELVHPDDRDRVLAAMAALKPGDHLELQYRIKAKDGSWRAVVDIAVCTIDDHGVLQLAGTFFDVTETREAERALHESERALRESEERYRTIVENATDAIMRLDSENRFTYANPSAVGLMDMEGPDLLGRRAEDVAPPGFGDQLTPLIDRARATGKTMQIEIEVPLPGGPRFFSLQMMPERPTGGEDRGSVLIMGRDLTERRVTEMEGLRQREALEKIVEMRTRELTEANERLRELDHLKSMFIASMSHELRTPLNSVIGFSGVLLSGVPGRLNAEQRTQLDMINLAGNHLLDIITDILDVSQVEAGSVEPLVEEFDLADLRADALELVRSDAESRGLDLEAEEAHVLMRTDRRRLLQCVVNLLSNAVKYTERGSVTMSVVTLGDDVAITITDTGIGISREDEARIFAPFTRLESRLLAATPGTGLGLYVTRKVANEVLSGDVTFSSSAGEGSAFTLTVPKELASAAPAPGVEAAAPRA